MGAFLEKPKTDKGNSDGEGLGIRYATASMQGWRVDMEDAHFVELGLDKEKPLMDWAFFGVFDGHNGSKVAQYSAKHLLQSILKTAQFKQFLEETKKDGANMCHKLLEESLKKGFLKLDAQMKDMPDINSEKERSGSTVICALLTPSHIFLANLGDSRAVLSKTGSDCFSTDDHKPSLPKERDRIVKAGGNVMLQRVNGSLAVSRALGDFEYKSVPGLDATKQLVSSEPDVYILDRCADRDEFLLLACDGVYDKMSNAELCDFIRSRMHVTDDLAAISNQVLDACLSKGSRDNMSMILVSFPAAPKVSTDAQRADAEWKNVLAIKVTAIVAQEDANPDENKPEVDVDFVMRSLLQDEIPGLPPGAGIHAARSEVDTILERIKKVKSKTVKSSLATESQTSKSSLRNSGETANNVRNRVPLSLPPKHKLNVEQTPHETVNEIRDQGLIEPQQSGKNRSLQLKSRTDASSSYPSSSSSRSVSILTQQFGKKAEKDAQANLINQQSQAKFKKPSQSSFATQIAPAPSTRSVTVDKPKTMPNLVVRPQARDEAFAKSLQPKKAQMSTLTSSTPTSNDAKTPEKSQRLKTVQVSEPTISPTPTSYDNKTSAMSQGLKKGQHNVDSTQREPSFSKQRSSLSSSLNTVHSHRSQHNTAVVPDSTQPISSTPASNDTKTSTKCQKSKTVQGSTQSVSSMRSKQTFVHENVPEKAKREDKTNKTTGTGIRPK